MLCLLHEHGREDVEQVRDTESDRAPAGTQAIGRALAVLQVMADSAEELSIAQISARLGLANGTTSRIVRALQVEGFVARHPDSDTFYLGSGAILLGQAAQRGFGLDKALPLLEQLNADTCESVNLVVRDGGESVVMLRVQSTLPLRFEQHPGARFPLYSTASGKAILAFSPDADSYVKSLPPRLEQLTPHTLTTPAKLAAQLVQVRRRGYSVDDQENVDGVRCVGAPVLDSDRRAQAALVVQVPAVRMPTQRVKELGELVQRYAKTIAQFVPVDRALSR